MSDRLKELQEQLDIRTEEVRTLHAALRRKMRARSEAKQVLRSARDQWMARARNAEERVEELRDRLAEALDREQEGGTRLEKALAALPEHTRDTSDGYNPLRPNPRTRCEGGAL